MNIRFPAVWFSLALIVFAPQALAQRFGEFLVGGGWSAQSHGAPTAHLPAERVSEYAALSGNLAKLLPTGTDLRAAASGFRNLGDFIAAVHVSRNLQVPFADLKARMMGEGTLGSAIAALRPEMDSQIEARRGRAAAYEELARV